LSDLEHYPPGGTYRVETAQTAGGYLPPTTPGPLEVRALVTPVIGKTSISVRHALNGLRQPPRLGPVRRRRFVHDASMVRPRRPLRSRETRRRTMVSIWLASWTRWKWSTATAAWVTRAGTRRRGHGRSCERRHIGHYSRNDAS